MSSVEKSVVPRSTDTSRSEDRDSTSTVGITAVEDGRETDLTVAYSPKESHDIEADIVFVGGVDGPSHLSDSRRDSDSIQSLESWDDSNTFESPPPIEVPDIWRDSEYVPPIVFIEIPESCSQRQKRRESKLLTWSQGLLSVQLGLVIFINTSAYRYVKNSFISRRGNARFDGEMMILRAYLLYLPKLQEQMEKCRRDTDPELEDAEDALLNRLPFFRYAVPYWMLHGGRVQRSIDFPLMDRETENMHMTVRRLFGVEKAGFPDSNYAFGLDLGFRSADRGNGADDVDFDQKESDTDILGSQGTVAALLDKTTQKSIEDGFSPILLKQKSVLGLESSETSKIREVLLDLIIDDDAGRQTYKTALETLSPGRIERNLHGLLRPFQQFYEAAMFYRDYIIAQPRLQSPDTRESSVPILSALSSSQNRGKRPNIVRQLERHATNSKALVTLRTGNKNFTEPKASFNSSALHRQVSAAVPTEERSPMLEEAKNILSNTSQNVGDLDIRQAVTYRPLFVGSTISQLLSPPLVLNDSLLFRCYRYIVGQVSGFLQDLNLYEPPLSEHCVRLKWICVSLSRPQITNLI